MKQKQRTIGLLLGALAILFMSSFTWAHIHYDNPLPAWENSGAKTVDFTNVDIVYTPGKNKAHGKSTDSTFVGDSTSISAFSLSSSVDGSVTNIIGFNGYIIIEIQFGPKGEIRPGGSFAIYSSDAMFGTDYPADYNCNAGGNNCTAGQLVFTGDVTRFGWSQTQGILEFETENFTGWAVDNWGQPANTTEHILLNVDCSTQTPVNSNLCFDSYSLSRSKPFTATVDGFAVVPAPQE